MAAAADDGKSGAATGALVATGEDGKVEVAKGGKDAVVGREEKLPWVATMLEIDGDAKEGGLPSEDASKGGCVHPTWAHLRKVLGVHIETTAHAIRLRFDSLNAAREWCGKMSTAYTDSAKMIGYEHEQLVQRYHFFRINEALYHILFYVWEGKLAYDAARNAWSNTIQKPIAAKYITEWIAKYKL